MIVYLHGFNSSPLSHKAQLLGRHLAALGLGERYACPALPTLASEALALVEPLLAPGACLVGSSLGGFYATWLAEKHGLRAVLINPAVEPHVGLRDHLGPQQNLYTGERYELTERHLRQWQALYAARITPSRYLLLVETGDEVLDWRVAVRFYAGAWQFVRGGGDHAFQDYVPQLPAILRFAGVRMP